MMSVSPVTQIDRGELAVEVLAKKARDIAPWLRCHRAVTVEDGKGVEREKKRLSIP